MNEFEVQKYLDELLEEGEAMYSTKESAEARQTKHRDN